jgi:hypothetical protein
MRSTVKKTSVQYTGIVNALPSPYLLRITLLNLLVLVLAIVGVSPHTVLKANI